MHTTKIAHGCDVVHNGDFSGEVKIHYDGQVLKIPFAYLETIVAECIRRQRIELLEQASTADILYRFHPPSSG